MHQCVVSYFTQKPEIEKRDKIVLRWACDETCETIVMNEFGGTPSLVEFNSRGDKVHRAVATENII